MYILRNSEKNWPLKTCFLYTCLVSETFIKLVISQGGHFLKIVTHSWFSGYIEVLEDVSMTQDILKFFF